MPTKIYQLKLGIKSSYLISDCGLIMIDSGPPKSLKAFQKQLKQFSLPADAIKLIVLTHADPDHAGSAKDIKEMTGAQVAIHAHESKTLEEGRNKWPPGVTLWGRINQFFLYPLFMKLIALPAMKPDIILQNDTYPLDEFGIARQIIHTPGHTRIC